MISLFASAQKDNSIDLEEDSKRARIQEVIDRAIQMPEGEIAALDGVNQFAAREDVTANAADRAAQKPDEAISPWDVVKQFMVHDGAAEHAA